MKVKTLRESLTDNGADKGPIVTSAGSKKMANSASTRSVDVVKASVVGFKSVTIREYALVIGDNPSCSSGVPLR